MSLSFPAPAPSAPPILFTVRLWYDDALGLSDVSVLV